MTQQQVISLYLANPNQRVKYMKGQLPDKTYEVVGLLCDAIFLEGGQNYKISDCKLILKRRSSMQYEDWVEMAGFVFDLKLVNETAITMRDLLCNGDGAMLSFKSIVKINEWLITHGYCLDEQWIENGWVTCQK